MLWRDLGRSFFMMVVSRRGVEVLSHELPFLGALQFWIVLERLFANFTSLSMWGKARVEFNANTSQKISAEIIPMEVLVSGNGVDRGKFGHDDYLLLPQDQAKVDPSDVLSTLLLTSTLPNWAVVVVKIFANLPYLPWGSFSFPYLYVITLAVEHDSCPIPT